MITNNCSLVSGFPCNADCVVSILVFTMTMFQCCSFFEHEQIFMNHSEYQTHMELLTGVQFSVVHVHCD